MEYIYIGIYAALGTKICLSKLKPKKTSTNQINQKRAIVQFLIVKFYPEEEQN